MIRTRSVVVGALAIAGAIVLFWFLRDEDGAESDPAIPAVSSMHTTPEAPSPIQELEAVSEREAQPVESTVRVEPTASNDPDMAPWGPWRTMRLDEVDRALEKVRADPDPTQRALQIQFLIIAAISPLADEMGLSEPLATADRNQPRIPHEHVFASNRNYYRIPEGTFPLLDDFMSTWNAREARRADMSPRDALEFDAKDPFPLDLFSAARLEDLVQRSRDAIRRRSEPY